MSLKHSKVSAVADGGDASLVQPSDWNAAHAIDADGLDYPAGTATPSAPASGKVRVFGRTIANRHMAAQVGPSGLSTALQPFFGRNKIGIWTPLGGSTVTAGMAFGFAVPTTLGTATARNATTTNLLTSMRRIGYVSGATAGQRAMAYTGVTQFCRGDAPKIGGFLMVFRWGCSDAATVAGARTFVGLAPSSTIGNGADPSTSVNILGIGTDAADANFSIMHNDGSGVATKIPLGANFPDHTLSADVYELALFCAPNSSEVTYEVTRLNTGDTATGTISTDLPVATQMLQPLFMRANNATALAVGIDVVGLYAETDY